jgi:hypothetical protein
MRKLLVTTAAVALLSAGAANAASISYNATLDFSGQALNFAAGPTVSFQQWNPALFPVGSVLTSAVIDWDADLSASGTYTAFTDGSITSWVAGASLTGTGPSSLSVLLAPGAPLVSAPGFAVTASQTGSVGPAMDDDQVQQTFNSGLATFTGNSTIDWVFAGILSNTVTTDGAIATSSSGNAGVTGRITYFYDVPPPPPPPTEVIPVPAALPLLATGLGLFGLMRLRRKAA